MAAVPYLAYDDAPGAIEFLCSAFGFRVEARMDSPDGGIGHAELVLGDGRVMLASVWRDAGVRSPAELGGIHSQVWVEVDDADEHYARARGAGAVVIGPPVEQGHGFRTYRAVDPEGHRWYFGSRLR